jgi:hypothetical protein
MRKRKSKPNYRKIVRLTAQGRLLSNDVFQEFLGLEERVETRG